MRAKTAKTAKHDEEGPLPPLHPALRDLPELRERARRADSWPAPRLVPTSYPGTAPDDHYLLVGEVVVPIAVQAQGFSLAVTLPDGTAVDEALARVGAAPLAQRVPVLAYGANRSPQSLAIKFQHHGDRASERVSAVPVLAVTVRDIDVVGAGLSSQGYIYADMTPSPGTHASVKLTLLDREQAAAIHRSEGVGQGMYDCAWVPNVQVGETPVSLTAIGYAGCVPVLMSPDTGTPLAFSAIAAPGRTFPGLGQVDMLAHVLRSAGIAGDVAGLLGGSGRVDPDADAARSVAKEAAKLLSGQWWYVHNTGDTPLAAASEVQRIIEQALGEHAAAESTSQRLAAEGKVLATDIAYAYGPEVRLSAQLST